MWDWFKDNTTKAYEKIMCIGKENISMIEIEAIIDEFNLTEKQAEILRNKLKIKWVEEDYEEGDSSMFESDLDDEYDLVYDEYDEEEIDDLED